MAESGYNNSDPEEEFSTTIGPPPKYFEKKFLSIIDAVGTFKIKGQLSYLLMPYYKIKLNCETKRYAYETVVVGDEFDEEDKARENAFRKACFVLERTFVKDLEDFAKIQRRRKPVEDLDRVEILELEGWDDTEPSKTQAEPLPKEFEEKFMSIIHSLGIFKVEAQVSHLLMHFYFIRLKCRTKRCTFRTTVVGDEFNDEEEARENAFKKAYETLQLQYKWDLMDLRSQRTANK